MLPPKQLSRALLWFSLLLGAGLFLLWLNRFPTGLYIDEALYGYNAYSILTTLRDEWGQFLPLFFRFYGSYNPPVYVYLTAISLKIFGLTVFGVRLVSSLAGVVAVAGIYQLAKKLWPKSPLLAGIAALILATAPWVMLYARTGYEVNLAMVFLLFGMVGLYRSLKDGSHLIAAAIWLSLASYTAYAERFIVPLFVFFFLLLFRREILIRSNYRPLFWAGTLGILLHLPHLELAFTPAFLPKAMETYKVGQSGYLVLREFFAQYSNYFSPASLFFSGDPDLQRSIPTLAVFYPWLVIPYFIGWLSLWRQRQTATGKFIFLMLLIFPLPAALTRDPFASHRAYPLVIPMVLVLALGLEQIRQKISAKLFWPAMAILVAASVLWLGVAYFKLMPRRAVVWMAGYDQIAQQIRRRPETHFVIDQGRNKPSFWNLGFFLPYPPEQFQSRYGDWDSFYYFKTNPPLEFNLGQIELRSINWQWDIYQDQILVVDPLGISPAQAEEHFLTPEFEIRSSVGELLFIGWRTNPKQKCLYQVNELPPECQKYQ